MFTQKFIGQAALALFVVAAVILLGLPVLVTFFPYLPLNAQAVLLAGGAFVLAAAILGLYAFAAAPGKAGAIGGLALVLAVVCLLSFTSIAGVRQSGAQQTSAAMPEGVRAGELTLRPCWVETRSGRLASDCGTLVVAENRTKTEWRLC